MKGRVKALKAALEEAEEDADRAVAEKEEFLVQWEEDVDALRRQLGAERKGREDDRRELEEAIFDLEDELDDVKVHAAVVHRWICSLLLHVSRVSRRDQDPPLRSVSGIFTGLSYDSFHVCETVRESCS